MHKNDISNTTVVIPTFNDSFEDLFRALKSVINQTYAPREIIVVDDGSSNDTSDVVVRAFAGTDIGSALTLFKKENGGPSSARNYGLNHCSTPYITFLDSDDEMLTQTIEVKEKTLKNLGDEYFGVYGSYIRNPGGPRQYKNSDGLMDADLVGVEFGHPGGAPNYLFRTQYLRDIGGFDEALVNGEDFDLLIRLIKLNLKAKGDLGPGYIRNYRYGSVSRNDQYIKTYNNVKRFLNKAEVNYYFSPQELSRRKAANELWIGRRLLGKGGCKRQAIKHLNFAFDSVRPDGWKQYAAYLIAIIGGIVFGNSKG